MNHFLFLLSAVFVFGIAVTANSSQLPPRYIENHSIVNVEEDVDEHASAANHNSSESSDYDDIYKMPHELDNFRGDAL